METMVEVDRVEGRKKEFKGRKRLRKLSRQYADDLKKGPIAHFCPRMCEKCAKTLEDRKIRIHIEGIR